MIPLQNDFKECRFHLQSVLEGGETVFPFASVPQADGWLASNRVSRIEISPAAVPGGHAGRTRYHLRIETRAALRIEIRLTHTQPEGPIRHILPGFLFGGRQFSESEAGHYPVLAHEPAGHRGVSPSWAMRVDRLAAPVAMVFGEPGWYLAIAGPPYTDLTPTAYVKNGLLAALPATIGYVIGYRNEPHTFINKDTFGAPTEQCLPANTVVEIPLDIFAGRKNFPDSADMILRAVDDLYYQAPRASVSVDRCIEAIADAAVRDAWNDERDVFMGIKVRGLPGQASLQHAGGRAIAWVGGANMAYPLRIAGERCQRPDWIAIAKRGLDRIARQVNPATGLFFDACDENWNPTVNYWWSSNTNRDLHSAYTNAEAAAYLLRASMFEQQHAGRTVAAWHDPALRACDVIIGLQREDGHCGYAYYRDRPEVADWQGFAGCWWAAAFCHAFQLTGRKSYLEAACRAIEAYWPDVRNRDVRGTPMDTWKANDQEGVLAFIRTARLLFELTDDTRYLAMLQSGAEYEFLWRYIYNTRPDAEPLRSAGWDSCGGSLTSISNPHIHPMGLLIADDLLCLAVHTADNHVRRRLEDGLTWARNCLELFPEKTGYGHFGWTGERYCQSDGLLITKYEDKSPASTELGFNPWAAGAMLEGFLA